MRRDYVAGETEARRWPAQHPGRIQLYSLDTPNVAAWLARPAVQRGLAVTAKE